MERSDEDLMAAFQAGEARAFEALVERHTRSLLGWFFHHGRDRSTAEDLTQDTWARVFRAPGPWQPRARFRTWLFTIARNLWIDSCRGQARRIDEVPLDAGEEEQGTWLDRLDAPDSSPESVLEEQDLAATLASYLGRLPEGIREVYLLGELEGLPYSEVAEVLGIPVGTVKSRMFTAIRRLRELLGPCEGATLSEKRANPER